MSMREAHIDIPLSPLSEAHTMHYVEWGNENTPRTVLCVHGLTRNGRDFDVLAAALAEKGFRVICPDIVGRGVSPNFKNPASYNNLTYAADCLYLLQQRGIKQVEWIGTSMGGMIALLVANQAPGLMRSLVLNDVGCLIEASAIARIAEYVAKPNMFATKDEAIAALRARTLPFSIPEKYWDDFATHSIKWCTEGFRLAYDPAIGQAMGALTNGGQPVLLWPLWEAVKPIPTLLVRGEVSDLLSKEVAAQMIATHPKLELYEVANAGHAPALMSEAEIEKIIVFFKSGGD